MKRVMRKNIFGILFCTALAFQRCTMKPFSGIDIIKNLPNNYPTGSKIIFGATGLAALIGLYKFMGYVMTGHNNGDASEKFPIVGGREHNITFYGLEKLPFHRFDSTKFGKVQKYLETECGISSDRLVKSRMVTDEELLSVHPQRYLDSLNSSYNVARIAEVDPLAILPNIILRRRLLNPMKLATGGTIEAAKLALRHGWAFNLGGGFHHAKSDSGGGFCFYADIPIAVKKLREENPNLRVLIVDLDAHQGNGHEAILGPDDLVDIFDMYNGQIYYPHDIDVMRYINFNVRVNSGIRGSGYIQILRREFEDALNSLETRNRQPNLIIFNAGTDPLDGDPLGRMKVSEEHMIERDQIVFEKAKERRIPVVYLTSGGYTSRSAKLIGKSIKNILENVIEQDPQSNQVKHLFQNN